MHPLRPENPYPGRMARARGRTRAGLILSPEPVPRESVSGCGPRVPARIVPGESRTAKGESDGSERVRAYHAGNGARGLQDNEAVLFRPGYREQREHGHQDADAGELEGAPAFRGPADYTSLTRAYRPPAGLPGPVLEAAVSFPLARSIEHREGLARLEAGLLYLGGARVRAENSPLPEKRHALILAEKLDSGQWLEVRSVYRYRDAGGECRAMARILTLSRDYALSLIRADTGERYAGLLDYYNGRRLPTRSPCCRNLPPELSAYLLEAGTDLVPDHEAALSLLELGESARGWRILSREAPGRVLSPSWRGKECGRFYAVQPALQTLPKRYRREALTPAGYSDGFAELDYACCQPNIARILAGLEPEQDYYAALSTALALSRESVKGMVLPILHGRTRGEHIYRYGRALAPVYDTIRAELPTPGERLMELEAEILRAVLARMRADGIPAGLPLHDSLLTAFPVPVQTFMLEESERVLGRPLPVKVALAGRTLAF